MKEVGGRGGGEKEQLPPESEIRKTKGELHLHGMIDSTAYLMHTSSSRPALVHCVAASTFCLAPADARRLPR